MLPHFSSSTGSCHRSSGDTRDFRRPGPWLRVLTLGLMLAGISTLSAAVLWQEGFEGGAAEWTTDGTAGVWELGAPTTGPGAARSGANVAATRLAGNYPNGADTRLVSPTFTVPAAADQPRLRYWYWYDTAFNSHFGRLQLRVAGGAWQDLDERISDRSGTGAWSQRIVDLRAFAGLNVQIGFRFVSTTSTVAAGWYVDDVSLETGPMAFDSPEDFENGLGDWSVENGVWQLGEPTASAGPAAHSGSRVVGTVLSGNYPNSADARLTSPEFIVPPAGDHPRFKYWYWYQTAFTSHYGQLQIRTSGGAWQDVVGERVFTTGGRWAQRIVDLRPFAGQPVQLGFRLVTTTSTVSLGWYVDDMSLETGPWALDEVPGFEGGFGEWSAEGGVWQVGEPTATGGPAPRSGTQVAGTILAGNYPNSVDARLVSPEFTVPPAGEHPRFRFWQWHDTAFNTHFGQVQIRTRGGAWQDVPAERVQSQSLGWSQRIIDLRPFTGQPVQIGFRFVSTTSTVRPGWYVDDAALETGPMVLSNPDGFENGFGDWSSQGGLWQIGVPTAPGGPQPFAGASVAGTVLAGDYFNNAEARLVTPEFVVPVITANPQLSFRHWINTPFATHNGRVQISTDGSNWTDLSPVYSGTDTNWNRVLLPLGAHAGQRVRLAFRFVSTTSTTRAGWYVDDFEILSDTLDPIADAVIPEGAPFTIPLVARGNNLQFRFGENGPDGAAVGPEIPELTWTPSETQGPGRFEDITVWVTQPDNWLTPVDRQRFTVVVQEVNVAPRLVVPAAQTLAELETLNVSATATDADLPPNALTFSLVNDPPAGMTIHPASGAISWTPTEAQGPQTYQISVRVTDNNPDAVNETQLSDTASFTVTVREVNTAPVLTVPANQTIDERTSLVLSATATDADLPPNALTFSLVDPPDGMTIHPETGVITWTPTEVQGPTNATVTVRVTDSSPDAVNESRLSDVRSFIVTVREVNQAPVLVVPEPQAIDEGTLLSVTATATDADLPPNALTFNLVDPPDGMTIHPETGVITWTPTEAQGPTNATVTVRVTDSSPEAVNESQLSDVRSFTVTVREVNQAPVLVVPDDATIDEETLLSVTATATDADLPPNPLTFSLVDPPAGMTIHPETGAIRWTPTEAQGPTNVPITVVVTDSNPDAISAPRLTDTRTFTVRVREVNLPPALGGIADASIPFGFAFSLQALASDPDLPSNVLTYSLEEAPAGMVIDASTGRLLWTPGQDQAGVHPVTVRVVDDGVPPLDATTAFTLTVAGDGPTLTASRVSGLIRIDMFGDTGRRYLLEAADDLKSWTRLLQFTLAESPQAYVDVDSGTLNGRYYRLLPVLD
ncbi:MAG: choice-of-anchor J domain-containing protein [Verrucomicrobiae bacterium]|nr:choice-of-anchor J domain-containing protein [Verrucomicrobiae bacterium]